MNRAALQAHEAADALALPPSRQLQRARKTGERSTQGLVGLASVKNKWAGAMNGLSGSCRRVPILKLLIS
jgi:hypothetical protein